MIPGVSSSGSAAASRSAQSLRVPVFGGDSSDSSLWILAQVAATAPRVPSRIPIIQAGGNSDFSLAQPPGGLQLPTRLAPSNDYLAPTPAYGVPDRSCGASASGTRINSSVSSVHSKRIQNTDQRCDKEFLKKLVEEAKKEKIICITHKWAREFLQKKNISNANIKHILGNESFVLKVNRRLFNESEEGEGLRLREDKLLEKAAEEAKKEGIRITHEWAKEFLQKKGISDTGIEQMLNSWNFVTKANTKLRSLEGNQNAGRIFF